MKNVFSRMLLILLSIAALQANSQSQNSSPTSVWYLEIPSINTTSYVTLHESFKGHSQFELSEACVPAHVVAIKLRPTAVPNADHQSLLINFIKTKGFDIVKPMDSPSPETFITRCQNARIGQ